MKRILILLFALGLVITSCEKIIAEDITGKTPVLLLPSVGDTVDVNPVMFKWEEMEGATKYHLMVVSPSFSAISQYVLDTLITGTDFLYSLDSNQYELKLAAVNGGYVSDTLGPVLFYVGVQPTVSTNTVVLTSPADGHADNSTFDHIFSWEGLTDASSYEISVREGTSFATGNIIETQNNISTNTHTLQATLTEGEYIWGVKAYYSSGGSTNFTTRTLTIDETTPNVAVLSSPLDNDFVSQGVVTFVWNNGTDPGTVNSTVTSTIEVSSNISFLTPEYTVDVVGNTTDITLPSGTFYWQVTNHDAAGNFAVESSIYQVTVL